METTALRPQTKRYVKADKPPAKDVSFKELEKRIMEARAEKKAGKLKQVNPKDIWGSI
jgi:hypothetical protein